MVAVWDVTQTVRTLNLDQVSLGTIATPYSLDRWDFSAVAGQQVQFQTGQHVRRRDRLLSYGPERVHGLR